VVDTRAVDRGAFYQLGNLMTFYAIVPMAAPRMTVRDKWKKRPVVLAYWAFRDELRLRKVEIPIPCQIIFQMPMPQSWSNRKRKAMHWAPHTVRPDCDNLIKAVLDAILAQDGHVWSIWAEKRWSMNPGIRIEPNAAIPLS
jgi:Holliday junction resolvase RusA-like endonuclease